MCFYSLDDLFAYHSCIGNATDSGYIKLDEVTHMHSHMCVDMH